MNSSLCCVALVFTSFCCCSSTFPGTTCYKLTTLFRDLQSVNHNYYYFSISLCNWLWSLLSIIIFYVCAFFFILVQNLCLHFCHLDYLVFGKRFILSLLYHSLAFYKILWIEWKKLWMQLWFLTYVNLTLFTFANNGFGALHLLRLIVLLFHLSLCVFFIFCLNFFGNWSIFFMILFSPFSQWLSLLVIFFSFFTLVSESDLCVYVCFDL